MQVPGPLLTARTIRARLYAKIRSMFSLDGKLALITGSSAGIGFALAEALAGAGAEIILNGRYPDKLGIVAAELRAKGHVVHPVAFDVTNPEAVEAAIARVESTIGPIHILVNNAGMQYRSPLRRHAGREMARHHAFER